MTLIVAMAVPVPFTPPSNVIAFPGGLGPSPLPPSNVIPFPGGAGLAPNLVALPGGLGAGSVSASAASGSALGGLLSWLARGGLVGALATIIVLGTPTPTGNLTITRHSPGTMSGPSPLPPSPPLPLGNPPPSVHIVTLGSPPFYHRWGGVAGQFQNFYLSRFPRGDTIVTHLDPESDNASIRATFQYWFGLGWENVVVTPPPGHGTPDDYKLRTGFKLHSHAQRGHFAAPPTISGGASETIRVFSSLEDRHWEFELPQTPGWGRPSVVWAQMVVGSAPVSHRVDLYGSEYIRWRSTPEYRGAPSRFLDPLFKEKVLTPYNNGTYEYQAYEIEYQFDAISLLKKRKKKRDPMPCCQAFACAAINRKLDQIQRDLTKYVKHDIYGYFRPICVEEGTKHPVTGAPIVDWDDERTAQAAARVAASGGRLFGGLVDDVPEIYADSGIAAIAAMIRSLSHQLADTAIATDRAKLLWCETEEPEVRDQVVVSGVTGIRAIDLPFGVDTTVFYVIIELTSYDETALRRFYDEDDYLRAPFPKRAWFGFVSFLDDLYRESPEIKINSSKMKLPVPFLPRRLILRLQPFVVARISVNGIFP